MDIISIAFDSIPTTQSVTHDPAYRDTMGRYRPLTSVAFTGAKPGDRLKMVDEEGNRIIIVVTPVGNVVVSQWGQHADLAICEAPDIIRGLCGRGKLGDDQVAAILGLWGQDNIGMVLSYVIQVANPKEVSLEN